MFVEVTEKKNIWLDDKVQLQIAKKMLLQAWNFSLTPEQYTTGYSRYYIGGGKLFGVPETHEEYSDFIREATENDRHYVEAMALLDALEAKIYSTQKATSNQNIGLTFP